MLSHHKSRSGIAGILAKNAVGAEIGVKEAGFSRVLASGAVPQRFYLIDPWWKLNSILPDSEHHVKTTKYYKKTLERMRWWIKKGVVEIVIERSQEALPQFADGYFDWIYLDSSHNFEQTQQELELCAMKTKREGVICGHDFHTHRHPGVFKAICLFLQRHPEYHLFYIDNFQQWAMKRRGENIADAVGSS